jgi:hypothetical protein
MVQKGELIKDTISTIVPTFNLRREKKFITVDKNKI